MRTIASPYVTAALAVAAFGQAQPVPRPAFEVASVRPSGPPPPVPRLDGVLLGGPGTNDPERITGSRMTLRNLLRQAYDVDFDQIQGPAWLADEKYDITAKVPLGTTKDQLKLMVQDLLAERFKMALHHVSKEFPVYELTIAKGGSKLKENAETLEPSRPGDPRLQPDRDGFPQFPPGKSGMAGAMLNGLNHMTAQGEPLSTLASLLSVQFGVRTGSSGAAMGRVLDKTGLTGKYDFKFEYAGGAGIGAALNPPAGPDVAEPNGGLGLVDAIEKQLGLKVTQTTAPYDVLVIDHAERVPVEN